MINAPISFESIYNFYLCFKLDIEKYNITILKAKKPQFFIYILHHFESYSSIVVKVRQFHKKIEKRVYAVRITTFGIIRSILYESVFPRHFSFVGFQHRHYIR